MDAGLTVGANGDVTDQGCHLNLLVDGDRTILFGFPLKERELRPAQGADCGQLGATHPLPGGKLLQHVHGLIAAVEDDGKRALAAFAMKQFTSHVSLQGPVPLRWRVEVPRTQDDPPAAGPTCRASLRANADVCVAFPRFMDANATMLPARRARPTAGWTQSDRASWVGDQRGDNNPAPVCRAL